MEYPQIFSFLYVKELSRHHGSFFPVIPGPDPSVIPALTGDLSYDLLETKFRPSAETTSGTKKTLIADQSSSSTR